MRRNSLMHFRVKRPLPLRNSQVALPMRMQEAPVLTFYQKVILFLMLMPMLMKVLSSTTHRLRLKPKRSKI